MLVCFLIQKRTNSITRKTRLKPTHMPSAAIYRSPLANRFCPNKNVSNKPTTLQLCSLHYRCYDISRQSQYYLVPAAAPIPKTQKQNPIHKQRAIQTHTSPPNPNTNTIPIYRCADHLGTGIRGTFSRALRPGGIFPTPDTSESTINSAE